MKKIILSVLTLIIAIIVGLGLYIDTIVKNAAQQTASQTLKTPVTLDGVHVSFLSKTVTVKGLVIHNVDGFSAENLLTAKKISAAAEKLFGDTIILSSISVDGLQVVAELKNGRTNLQALMKNVHAKQPSSSHKGTTERAAKPVIIRDLEIRNATVIPATALAGQKMDAAIDLPAIHMTNLGTDNAAIETPEAIRRVLTELLNVTTQTMSLSFFRDTVGKNLDALQDGVAKQIDDAGTKLQGLFK